MSYIGFDKSQLVNLEYSLDRELIRSNRAGSYSSTTLVNCNTRKYHGLLVTPQPNIDNDNHVLLSALDETVIQQSAEFNLGIHMYPGGIFNPKGHKYIREFVSDPIPKATYRVGGVVLTKEKVFSSREDRIMIRYTLKDAHSPTRLRLKPFLAFRNVHQLSKANLFVESKYEAIESGIKMRMYQGYTPIYMQLSKEPEYTHVPDWYYNIEYIKEMERGYDFQEDLFVPGFFEFDLKKGESVVFSCGLTNTKPDGLKRRFSSELTKRIPRDSFKNCLINAAQQFIVKRDKITEVIAGFPWFGRWGRDTFIALPGLTLVEGEDKLCKDVIDSMLDQLSGPLFPNIGTKQDVTYNSVDASLWFFWTIQQYQLFTDAKNLWQKYGQKMKLILDGYREGTLHNIRMHENGLIWAGEKGMALTWMDAVVDGKPVTPRIGYAVEVNALWYNAMMISLELAKEAGDDAFISAWESVPEKTKQSFIELFWNKEKLYLADYVGEDGQDWSVRPNQIFAASLPYSMLKEEQSRFVVDIVKRELLTPRGLRTLSPKNPNYEGTYSGNQAERDSQYHQGVVWPWLLGHFAEAYLRLHKKGGVRYINELLTEFEDTMKEAGIGSVSEIYNGDPPHYPAGAISQAWSVAELLRISWMVEYYKDK